MNEEVTAFIMVSEAEYAQVADTQTLRDQRDHARAIAATLEAAVARDQHYKSTACHHGIHVRCRRECKFCDRPCRCFCHEDDAT